MSNYGQGGVWQRGSVWWIRYRKNGRQYREPTNAADRRKALEILGDRLPNNPRVVNAEAVTYEMIRRNYLDRAIEKGLRTLKRVGTEEHSHDTIPRLDESFGGRRVATISLADLRRFRSDGKADGLSDARLNRYMTMLRAMLKQAYKDEMITSKEMPAYFPMVREYNEGKGAIYCEPEWYEALRKELSEPLRSFFTLSYHVGIRVGGELLRLRWRDIDFKKRQIHLPGQITKTGRPRIIFLPKDFDLRPGKPDEIVFPLGDYSKRWRSAAVKVGAGWFECRECGARSENSVCPKHGQRRRRELRYVGLLLRHTRHTATRNLVDAGLNEDRARAITGHLTGSVFSRYNIGKDSDIEDTRKAMEEFHRKRK